MADERRMDFDLSPGASEALDELCRLRGVDRAEAIRRALGTELFVRQQLSEGNRIVLERRRWWGGRQHREVIFGG